jgi:hypothetical protein
MAIMIAELKAVRFDFYGYLAVILLTGVSFFSVWVFPAWNGEYKKVELSMYFVTGIIVLFSMVLLALVEVLPNDIIEFMLRSLISKGNTYDIWSRPPYQLAHFVIMVGAFPYVAAFIISKIILKYKNYHMISNNYGQYYIRYPRHLLEDEQCSWDESEISKR